MLLAKYIIGPVKLFAGYEHMDFANPNNPLAVGHFKMSKISLGTVNDAAFCGRQDSASILGGTRYAVTSDLT